MRPRGGTLGIFVWACAARTLEPLAYTRASFSWILVPYPTVAVFRKLRSLAQSKVKPKQSLIYTTIASLLKKDLFILVRVFFPSSPKFQVNLIEQRTITSVVYENLNLPISFVYIFK